MSNNLEKNYIRKINRQKSKTAKYGLFWCGCDRQIISQVGKCPVCGNRENRKKIKY